jgi:hypothetical protein
MKILLVPPAAFEPGRLGLENSLWLSEPVALTSVAAMVPEHDVKILDMRLERPGREGGMVSAPFTDYLDRFRSPSYRENVRIFKGEPGTDPLLEKKQWERAESRGGRPPQPATA